MIITKITDKDVYTIICERNLNIQNQTHSHIKLRTDEGIKHFSNVLHNYDYIKNKSFMCCIASMIFFTHTNIRNVHKICFCKLIRKNPTFSLISQPFIKSHLFIHFRAGYHGNFFLFFSRGENSLVAQLDINGKHNHHSSLVKWNHKVLIPHVKPISRFQSVSMRTQLI